MAAAYILRFLLTNKQLPVYRHTKYGAVPAMPGRLQFLQHLFRALPPVFYTGQYQRNLLTYLKALSFPHSKNKLIMPLSLLDIRLAAGGHYPVDMDSFNQFFIRKLMKFNGKTFQALPSADQLSKALSMKLIADHPRVFGAVQRAGQPAAAEAVTTSIGGLDQFLHCTRVARSQMSSSVSWVGGQTPIVFTTMKDDYTGGYSELPQTTTAPQRTQPTAAQGDVKVPTNYFGVIGNTKMSDISTPQPQSRFQDAFEGYF
nr:CP52k-like protein 10 isoform 2 [Chelonibia testudinaria]